jgi:RNA polymerase sigma factor (sigma-70 family)
MDAIALEIMAEKKNEEVKKTVLKEQNRLFNFIKRSVGDIEDARDILQDVFYQFIVSYDNIRSAGQTTSWLYTVAKNRIIDMFRKKKPIAMSEIKIVGQDPDNEEMLSMGDILPDHTNLPDDEAYYNMLWDELENAIEELPEKQKDVFVMHEFEGKSFNEISEITRDPINTLISRKRYAVIYLRERLRELFKEF